MLKFLCSIILFFSLFITDVIAQNWEPFPHTMAFYSPSFGYKHFYLPLYNINETDTFHGVGIGNLLDLTYEEDILLIEELNIKAGLVGINDASRKTWIKTYKKTDNHIQFVSEKDNIIKINLSGSDTFHLVTSLDTTYYISQIDSIEVSTTDSILHFGIYTLDNLQLVEGSNILISKNKGILQMPIVTFFPHCIPTTFEGSMEDIYPYDTSKRHLLLKHYQGDELHSIYEEGFNNTFKTKIYTKKIYVNQTYNSDSSAFYSDVDVWTVKQTRTGFMQPYTQTSSFNSYIQQMYTFGNINAIYVPDGIPHFLDSNGAFVKRFKDDHWEASQWYHLVTSSETLYPHLELGYTRMDEFPSSKYELRTIRYQKINGEEKGTAIPEGFFLSNIDYTDVIPYTLDHQQLKLLHPEDYKSGRIYSIDGKFKTYLSTEQLNQPIITSNYPGLHTLIVVHKNGGISSIKF